MVPGVLRFRVFILSRQEETTVWVDDLLNAVKRDWDRLKLESIFSYGEIEDILKIFVSSMSKKF